jgi:hypothetical protein
MLTPETDPDARLRALRERIDALIERLGGHRPSAIRPPPKSCGNALELSAEIARALAACGYGRADIGAIAEAALEGVVAALADDDGARPDERPAGSAALYRLRAFEVAVVGGGAETEAGETEQTAAADGAASGAVRVRVALRGARRMLLPDGGEVVRLRFSMLAEMTES